MAQLAIKGHKTRGKEVIEILEMLGGKDINEFSGECSNMIYTIKSYDYGEIIHMCYGTDGCKVFTLEEFLEKFPYKVGDKAQLDGWPCVITEMSWGYDDVIYSVKGVDFSKRVCSKDLQPYKEETAEEIDIMNHTTEINLNHPCFKGCNEIEIIIPDGWEFKRRDNKMFGVRKQYPKTYEECCKILKHPIDNFISKGSGYKAGLLSTFQKLLIYRDAYWKIAGEQMGLDKPWEPDWDNEDKRKHVITCQSNNIIKDTYFIKNTILAFPTGEMRDAFYENFKDLIEEAKNFYNV